MAEKQKKISHEQSFEFEPLMGLISDVWLILNHDISLVWDIPMVNNA